MTPRTVANAIAVTQEDRLSEIDLRMAKVAGNKLPGWDQQIGQAIDYAISLSNRTQKEVWAAMGYETGTQLSLWISGERTADFAKLFAIEWLRQPLVIALAGLAGAGVEIQTVICVRRVL